MNFFFLVTTLRSEDGSLGGIVYISIEGILLNSKKLKN